VLATTNPLEEEKKSSLFASQTPKISTQFFRSSLIITQDLDYESPDDERPEALSPSSNYENMPPRTNIICGDPGLIVKTIKKRSYLQSFISPCADQHSSKSKK